MSPLRLGVWVTAIVTAAVILFFEFPAVPCNSVACVTDGGPWWLTMLLGWSRSWYVGPGALLFGALCGGVAERMRAHGSAVESRVSGALRPY